MKLRFVILLISVCFCNAGITLEWLPDDDGELLGVPVVIGSKKYLFTLDTGSTDLVVSGSDQQCCGCSLAVQQCIVCRGEFPSSNLNLQRGIPECEEKYCNDVLPPVGTRRRRRKGSDGEKMLALDRIVNDENDEKFHSVLHFDDRNNNDQSLRIDNTTSAASPHRRTFYSGQYCLNQCLLDNRRGGQLGELAQELTLQSACLVATTYESAGTFYGVAATLAITVGRGEEFLKDESPQLSPREWTRFPHLRDASSSSTNDSFVEEIDAGDELVFSTQITANILRVSCETSGEDSQSISIIGAGFREGSAFGEISFIHKYLKQENQELLFGLRGLNTTSPRLLLGDSEIDRNINEKYILKTERYGGHFRVELTSLVVLFEDPTIKDIHENEDALCTVDTGSTVTYLPANFTTKFLSKVGRESVGGTFIKDVFKTAPPEITISLRLAGGVGSSFSFGSYLNKNGKIMIGAATSETPCLLGMQFLAAFDATFFYGDSTRGLEQFVALAPPSDDSGGSSWKAIVGGTVGGVGGAGLLFLVAKAISSYWRGKKDDVEESSVPSPAPALPAPPPPPPAPSSTSSTSSLEVTL